MKSIRTARLPALGWTSCKRTELADLIGVDGNPLEDLSALEAVEVVVKGGEVGQ